MCVLLIIYEDNNVQYIGLLCEMLYIIRYGKTTYNSLTYIQSGEITMFLDLFSLNHAIHL